MTDKTRVYVFEKKEIWLIFMSMAAIALVSFMLGLTFGARINFSEKGFTEQDLQSVKGESVEMTSAKEEEVKAIEAPAKSDNPPDIEGQIKQEMEALKDVVKETPAKEAPKDVFQVPEKKTETEETKGPANIFAGKFTIQVGAFPAKAEAEEFSESFRVLGYNPIITEKVVKSQLLYRVSLGIFQNIEEAKQFILDNKSFFTGREYFPSQFD